MKDIQALREKATNLRKQKNYNDALPIYKQLWEETNNKWDGWGFALCCNQIHDYDKAYEVSKEILDREPYFEYGQSQFIRAVLKLMNNYDKKGVWSEILALSDELNHDQLNTKDIKINKNGKNISLPSERKSWYLKKSKALEKLNKWDECLEISTQALVDFPNEIWFKRRKAVAEGKTGNVEKAIKDLKRISLEKPDWFIYRDIAVLYANKGDYENALYHIIEGSLVSYNLPDPSYRWELYYDTALFLKNLNDYEMSKKHLELAFSLRQKEGWKIPPVLFELADELNVTLGSKNTIKDIMEQLQIFWKDRKFSRLPKYSGVIKKILPNGKAGFISSNDGKDIYFRIFAFNGKKHLMKQGTKVHFYIQDSFDRVKQEKSVQAVNVTPMV